MRSEVRFPRFSYALAVLFCIYHDAYSFLPATVSASKAEPHPHSRRTPLWESVAAAEQLESSPPATFSVNFKADVSMLSETAPSVCHSKMAEFFQIPDHRNLIFNGGGTHPIEEWAKTPALMEMWSDEARIAGALPPDTRDTIIAVKTAPFYLLGLRLDNTSVMGSKLVTPKFGMPFLESVLITDYQVVSGGGPFVWIYNRVIGRSEQKTRSYAKITVEESKERKEVQFSIHAYVSVNMELPRALARIMPMSVAKIEAKGSAAIRKVVEKATSKSLSALRDSFARFTIE